MLHSCGVAKRIQIRVQDSEYREIQAAANARDLSITEWMRQALVMKAREQKEIQRKLRAVRVAAKHESPTGDIETMLAEIEQGYLSDNGAQSVAPDC